MPNLTSAKSLDKYLSDMAAMVRNLSGDALAKTHKDKRLSGSQWTTLTAAMVALQNGACAFCGDDMRNARTCKDDAITLTTLIPSHAFGTLAAQDAITNGTTYVARRFGFMPGNVVAVCYGCMKATTGETASAARLSILPSQVMTTWHPDDTRAAKVNNAARRADKRRRLQAMGWLAES